MTGKTSKRSVFAVQLAALHRSDRATVLIEMALLLPLLLMLLMGSLVYGQYFYLAHDVQRAANDAARAALAGWKKHWQHWVFTLARPIPRSTCCNVGELFWSGDWERLRLRPNSFRHCERSEAIQSGLRKLWIGWPTAAFGPLRSQ